MGYMIELNTLLALPKDFDITSLTVGKIFVVTKERERAFPLNIAVLLVDSNWNFYGYCVVRTAALEKGKTTLEFEVLTKFSESEKEIYKLKFLEATAKTGELSK